MVSSSKFKQKNKLDKYLLKGLKTKGVPKNLENSIHTFLYNDLGGLKKLINKNQKIGIIKMEVIRNFPPNDNFLKK